MQTFLLQRDDEAIREVYAWLLGRLQRRRLGRGAARSLPYAVVSIASCCSLAGRRLDVLAVGDEEAEALGLDPRRVRLIVVIVAASLGTPPPWR